MATLPTASIALQGARIRLDGGALRVEHPDHPPRSLPLGHLGGLVLLGAVELTTAAMRTLTERGIACVIASQTGRVQAVVAPWTTGGLARRAAQHRLEDSRAEGRVDGPHLALARAIIDAKCGALLDLLAQHQRTHHDIDLSEPIARIRAQRSRASSAGSIDELRGHEGAAMACYFSAMPALCRTELTTCHRTRRPPRDPVNAALSFGYSLLVCEMTAALLARGLDPMLGILHPPEGGRPSLALDLIEPLRHTVVDRMVLRAANRRELTTADFTVEQANATEDDLATPEQAFRLTEPGRAKFLSMFQMAMVQPNEQATEPRVGVTVPGRAQISNSVAAYELLLQAQLSESRPVP